LKQTFYILLFLNLAGGWGLSGWAVVGGQC